MVADTGKFDIARRYASNSERRCKPARLVDGHDIILKAMDDQDGNGPAVDPAQGSGIEVLFRNLVGRAAEQRNDLVASRRLGVGGQVDIGCKDHRQIDPI